MDTAELHARIEKAREDGAEIETGEPAAPDAVDELEKELGTPLPPDYRTFLLTYGWMSSGGDSTISGIVDGTNYSIHGGAVLSDTGRRCAF